MQRYQGKSIYEGIAIGKICVYQRETEVQPREIADADAELERYRQAREKALEQLRRLCESVRRRKEKAEADIFEAHQMLLEDSAYNRAVEDMVLGSKVNAEYAVACAGEKIAQGFSVMEDECMRARAADVRDISLRVIRILKGGKEGEVRREADEAASGQRAADKEPLILVTEELTPSETVQIDLDRIGALVMTSGSLYSHSVILARGMEIPALTGVNVSLDHDLDGRKGIVDGAAGVIYVDPDETFLTKMQERQREERERKSLLQDLRGRESVTRDGRRVRLCANIGGLRELDAVQRNDAEGIGLFRSEFLYLERDRLPTEEEQFAIYKAAAQAMGEKPVVIRTLDIGADKQCGYLGLEREENPALGCRAIRICLTRPEIFKTQLRALLRAAVCGNLAIMYPMITGVNEIRQIREILEEVKVELRAEHIPFGEPRQGIMIETPAAVMMSGELAEEVDFFSIGTNDLTQYALAMDRQNAGLDGFFDPHHPAVLRMIRMAVENAHRAGIRAGICGELGADRELTGEFLAIGVDELSMSPDRILPVRKLVREIDLGGYGAAAGD